MADPLTPARRPTALVVDDEPEIRRLLVTVLGRAMPQIEVRQAGDGATALSLIRETAPDVIVSDFRMPGMDGLEMLRRSLELAPAAKRIMATAYPDTTLAMRALNEGQISRFLVKPFTPREMVEAVRAVLGEKEKDGAEARGLARAFAALA